MFASNWNAECNASGCVSVCVVYGAVQLKGEEADLIDWRGRKEVGEEG